MATERFEVPPEGAGLLLDRYLRMVKGAPPWSKVRAWIERGCVSVDGHVERTTTFPLAAGSVVEFNENGLRRREERAVDPRAIPILFQDSQVVVVVKPAFVSTEPYDAQEKDTLVQLLRGQLGGRPLYVVHRLDKETTGILVFARTPPAKDHLKNQFRFRTTGRRYLALAHGFPRPRTISSHIVRDRGDGLRGSTDNKTLGRASVTHVTPLEELQGASLVECRLETGRTHQIRIHLAEAGHPLLGERVYSKGYQGPLLAAPRVMLHAETLEFDHPTGGQRLRYQVDPPADFTNLLEALRKGTGALSSFQEPAPRDVRPSAPRTTLPKSGAGRPPRGRPTRSRR
ncbi:MAG: hypothetical protein B6A08_05140 [Sorangiineae bacterium NIC37A_2]|nr:MAG: hypothetical protein B6A08_05140 [Sorangiineae bacterium NIC37A_2]